MWIGTVCDGGFSKCSYVSGINELTKNFTVNVFPNPAKEYIKISVTDNLINRKVELFNVMNQKMADYLINGGIEEFVIPLKNLTDGIYFLKIGDANTRFIIQN
jgi:hypothetical protein